MAKEEPVYIYPEGTQRNQGRTAQRMNILAAKLVAESVRTTLGPKGMDKMLVDSLGDVTVTNDGVTILKEMNIEHPSAKMIVEIAKTQEDEIGDGTTTAVVIAGELLKQAENLLDQNIHPTIITKGYRLASEKSFEILNKMAIDLKHDDKETIQRIGETAMTGKGAEDSKHHLSKLIVEAVYMISRKKESKTIFNKDDIKIEKKTGGTIEDSEIINGIVIDKEKVHSAMPEQIKNAKIALIESALEVKGPETDTKISITEPSKMQEFLDMEESMIRKMVEKISATGANTLFCQKGIDELAQHFLAKKGIYACRRIKKSDMERLSKATGARIVADLKDFSSKDLGKAGIVEQVKVGEENMTYIKECDNPKSITLLIRGATLHVTDEVKRAVEDAIGDIYSALKKGKIVAGAGSTEIELANELKKYSAKLQGKEQLAVNAYADALEIIPKTLAENAGLDPIDVLTSLKAEHEKGNKWAGINVFNGKVMDAWKEGVIEPLSIKTQAISSATEVAVMVLRIDDIILAEKNSPKNQRTPNLEE